MAAIDSGNSTAGKANVDANFNANVVTPQVLAQAGFVGLMGINDDGSVVSGGRRQRVYVSEGNGLFAANKNLLWDDTFNATAQNTSKYKFAATTQTGSMAGGFLILNASGITTINTNSAIQTFRVFPLFAKAELRINMSGMITVAPQVNAVTEMGLFSATLPGGAAPSDGVFFRWNAAGEFRGVISYNGTETQTAAMTSPSINVNHDFLIVVQTNTALFYVDDILVGKITLLTDAPGLGQPMMMASQPFTARYYINGSAPSLASQLKLSDVFISELGPDLGRPWPLQKAGFGHMAYQGQNGSTMGSTSNLGNTALAAASALSNTAVGTGNPAGLGGYSHDLCTLAAGTDGIVTSYQNPAAGVNATGRNLVITGVWVHSVIDVAITGGPPVFLYSLAYGHTAVSLATAESASFASGTTKAPRRIALGCEGAGATVGAGTLLSHAGVYRQFSSPVVVAPGEFVAVVGRNIGAVATAGSVVHVVGFDAHFE